MQKLRQANKHLDIIYVTIRGAMPRQLINSFGRGKKKKKIMPTVYFSGYELCNDFVFEILQMHKFLLYRDKLTVIKLAGYMSLYLSFSLYFNVLFKNYYLQQKVRKQNKHKY